MVAIEVTLTYAFIGAVEKTVVLCPEWDEAVFHRVTQFFRVGKKGLTWASIVVGYGIAKATGKTPKEIFASYGRGKRGRKSSLTSG